VDDGSELERPLVRYNQYRPQETDACASQFTKRIKLYLFSRKNGNLHTFVTVRLPKIDVSTHHVIDEGKCFCFTLYSLVGTIMNFASVFRYLQWRYFTRYKVSSDGAFVLIAIVFGDLKV